MIAPDPSCGQAWANRTVGLLGGSFNPAHGGHRHISLQAMKRLGLDAVWWMVSPQNPLKPARGMAPLDERMAGAEKIARHPRIIVTDIESRLGTRYTADTLAELKKHFPRTRFVWLMGTDNLHQFHEWKNWQDIFRSVPVCVLDRPPAGSGVQACPAAVRFRQYLKPQEKAKTLAAAAPPAWTILHIPLNSLSATRIREKAEKKQ